MTDTTLTDPILTDPILTGPILTDPILTGTAPAAPVAAPAVRTGGFAPAVRSRRPRLLPEPGGQRILAAASLANKTGTGLFITSSVFFFTQVVGLSTAQVGVGLAASALIGLAAGIPMGHLADRRGPRGVYIMTLLLEAAGMAAFLLVREFWTFCVVASLTMLAESASMSAFAPLVRALGGDSPTRFRAYLRAVTNLGYALGAVVAGVAISIGTREVFTLLVVLNAASYAVSALVVRRLTPVSPIPVPPRTDRWIALKDRPYMLVSAINGVIALNAKVLTFALPLWIALHTRIPTWIIAASVVVNAAIVTLFQVRASRGVDSVASAGRAARRCGFALLAAMSAMGAAVLLPGALAVGVLIVAVVVYSVGELWFSASGFELGFALAPAHAQGQYSGVFGLGFGLSTAISPVILSALCVSAGVTGWIVAGALFALAGCAMPYAAARAAAAAGPAR